MSDQENTKSTAAACPPESALLDAFEANIRLGDYITIADDPTVLVVTEIDNGVARCVPYSHFAKMKINHEKSLRRKNRKEPPFYRKIEKRRI